MSITTLPCTLISLNLFAGDYIQKDELSPSKCWLAHGDRCPSTCPFQFQIGTRRQCRAASESQVTSWTNWTICLFRPWRSCKRRTDTDEASKGKTSRKSKNRVRITTIIQAQRGWCNGRYFSTYCHCIQYNACRHWCVRSFEVPWLLWRAFLMCLQFATRQGVWFDMK